jgi:hypothetical protein
MGQVIGHNSLGVVGLGWANRRQAQRAGTSLAVTLKSLRQGDLGATPEAPLRVSFGAEH